VVLFYITFLFLSSLFVFLLIVANYTDIYFEICILFKRVLALCWIFILNLVSYSHSG
jgi:hypothetical protein